jgi:hypothetical protein
VQEELHAVLDCDRYAAITMTGSAVILHSLSYQTLCTRECKVFDFCIGIPVFIILQQELWIETTDSPTVVIRHVQLKEYW